MTLLLGAAGFIVVLLIAVTVILTIVGPTILLKPRRRTPAFYRALGQPVTPEGADLRFEEINVHTYDGLKLNSWLVKTHGPPAAALIYLHGVADCKIDGIPLAAGLVRRGFNVFLYDSRGHGESEGLYCTYGFYEKHDVTAIVDYLRTRPDLQDAPIALIGSSMGAAVALQAAAIDPRIRAVIAENSFATLRSIFDDYQRRMIKLPFHYLRNLVIRRSEMIAGFKANAVSPLDAVGNIEIPIFFVCGEHDTMIKSEYSRKLFEAAGPRKDLLVVPGASHNDTRQMAGAGYLDRIEDFVRKAVS